MPMGKGTYGSAKGRPAKKNKKKTNMKTTKNVSTIQCFHTPPPLFSLCSYLDGLFISNCSSLLYVVVGIVE